MESNLAAASMPGLDRGLQVFVAPVFSQISIVPQGKCVIKAAGRAVLKLNVLCST
jgi:hypothetical protein